MKPETNAVIVFCFFYPAIVTAQQVIMVSRSAMVNDTNVFIQCPYEAESAFPVWRINDVDYTSASLPSVYELNPGGLFITQVHECMDGYTFQCIDISGPGLVGRKGPIETLSVIPSDSCTEDLQSMFERNNNMANEIKLNHRSIEFGTFYTMLAWNIFTMHIDCNVSVIKSYPPCQRENSVTNITNITNFTMPARRLHTSGVPANFDIYSLSRQIRENDCPRLRETLEFNVTETETVKLLLGKNNCTCLEINCFHGALTAAIAGDQDIFCSMYTTVSDKCVRVGDCHKFNEIYENYDSYFSVCENSDGPACTLCFDNVTQELNGMKLYFFESELLECGYPIRRYFRAFTIEVSTATAGIIINEEGTIQSICFDSSLVQECSLAHLTLYNASITDITGNLILLNDSVPESHCITIIPHCAPFRVLAQPYTINDKIIYNPIDQQVMSGVYDGNICRCLQQSVQYQVHSVYLLQNSSTVISYSCTSAYAMQPELLVTVTVNITEYHYILPCLINGTIAVDTDTDIDNGVLEVCVYWMLTNGSDCSLYYNTLPIPSPSEITTQSRPSPQGLPPYAIGIMTTIMVISIIAISILMLALICYWRVRRKGSIVELSEHYSVRSQEVTCTSDLMLHDH